MRDGESSRTKWDEMRQTELSRGFDWWISEIFFVIKLLKIQWRGEPVIWAGRQAIITTESLLSCRVAGIKLTMVNIAHVFLHLIFRKEWISKELYCGLSAAHKTSHFNSLCSLWGLWRLASRVLASLVESGKDFISHSYPS